jgi:copper chaperone NosL
MKYAVALCLCVMLVGCSRTPSDAPPVVHYGRDECAHCGMIVSDERFAAALRVNADGAPKDLIFDDIGDMLDYQREKGASIEVLRRYVHDYTTKEWTDAATAAFVKSEEVHSPMGSGIVAASGRKGGEELQAKLGGKLLSFTEVSAKDQVAKK